MYILNCCYLCLCDKYNLKSILIKDIDGTEVEKKLKFCLSEIVDLKPEIPKYICNICLENVNSFYNFKQTCLENNKTMNNYLRNMIIDTDSHKQISLQTLVTHNTNLEVAASNSEILQVQVTTPPSTAKQEDPLSEKQIGAIVKEEPIDEIQSPEFVTVYKEEPADIEDALPVHQVDVMDIDIKEESPLEDHSQVYNKLLHNLKDETDDPAGQTSLDLLPEKTKERYLAVYKSFKLWCRKKSTRKLSENVLLAYFTEKSKVCKSSSLWKQYSMLKSTLNVHENVNIAQYAKLIVFLQHTNDGKRNKKSNILTRDEFYNFLTNADDKIYLMMKVALILGISGACHQIELTNIVLDHIEDRGTFIIVNIPDTKTKSHRQFTVTSASINGVNCLEIYRKYVALRPQNVGHRRLFLTYRCGSCTILPVGLNAMGKIAEKIAVFLNLPNPKSYTGHCFRRSSAPVLADTGADLINLKQHDTCL